MSRDAATGRVPRWVYAALAYLFVALALVGVLLPGLPTIPFLLLAAWAAARGSRRLHHWLYRHPRFGSALIEWEEQGAVSGRSKRIAILLLVVSWLVMLWRLRSPWISGLAALLFGGVAAFLLTRPEPVGGRTETATPTDASRDAERSGRPG